MLLAMDLNIMAHQEIAMKAEIHKTGFLKTKSDSLQNEESASTALKLPV
jgi:hypothetical protein